MANRNSYSTPIIIVWICVILGLISKVDTVYVELDCPMNFEAGNNSVTCIVDRTLLSSKCSRTLNTIQFIYTKPDLTQVNECETPIYRPSDICPSTFSTGKNSNSTCRCGEISGNFVKYQLIFQANKALHDGITWICNVCSTQDPVDENFTLCSNIKFATKPDNGSSSEILTPGETAGVVIGVIFGIAIIITIILVIYHFACGHELCGRQGYTPCCRPAGKEKKESSNVQRTEKHLSEAHPMRHPE